MERFLEALKDFDSCHDYENDLDKQCKNCSIRQQQLCEAEVNLTDNKPIGKEVTPATKEELHI